MHKGVQLAIMIQRAPVALSVPFIAIKLVSIVMDINVPTDVALIRASGTMAAGVRSHATITEL